MTKRKAIKFLKASARTYKEFSVKRVGSSYICEINRCKKVHPEMFQIEEVYLNFCEKHFKKIRRHILIRKDN